MAVGADSTGTGVFLTRIVTLVQVVAVTLHIAGDPVKVLAYGPRQPFADPLHVRLAFGHQGTRLLEGEFNGALNNGREALQHVLIDPVVKDLVLPDRFAGAGIVSQFAADIDLRVGQRKRDLDRLDRDADFAAVVGPVVAGLLGDGEAPGIEAGGMGSGRFEHPGQLVEAALLTSHFGLQVGLYRNDGGGRARRAGLRHRRNG